MVRFEHVRHDELDGEGFELGDAVVVAPFLGHPHQCPKIGVGVLAVAHELDLTRRARLDLVAGLDIELPAIARAIGILDDRHDIDAEPRAHKRHRCGLALDLEVLDRFCRILFDEQIVDRVAQALERLVVGILVGDVKDDIDIDRIDVRFAQDRIFGERACLDDLGDLDLGLVANRLAQLGDEPVNLLVVLLALLGGQAKDVAIVVAYATGPLDVIALALLCQQRFFLKLKPAPSSSRDRALGWTLTPLAASSLAASSGIVISGSASTQPISVSRCTASLPVPGGRPCLAGAVEPVAAARCASFTEQLALTPKWRATLRRE